MMMWVVAAIAVAILVLVAIPTVLAILTASRRRAQNLSAPQLEAEARVVDKRSLVSGGGQSPASQRYYVTFQLPDGSRFELRVPASESGLLVVGDQGRLSWRGTDYLGFAREIMR